MNIKYIICATLLIICYSCKNDLINISYPEFYRGYNKVILMIDNDQLDAAIRSFDSLSSGVPHIPSSTLFRMARACAEEGQCDLAAEYLKRSLINGKEYGKGMGTYKTIVPCPEETAVVLEEEANIHAQYFNYRYKTMIDSMYKADQHARSNESFEVAMAVDSLNMFKLLELIEQYGYPGEKTIGHDSAFNAFIMLLHMDRDKNNKVFRPILEKAYNDGYLWPSGLAWIVDRRRSWSEDRLEPYYYHMPSRIYDQFSKAQKEEINRRRDSIGLEPK